MVYSSDMESVLDLFSKQLKYDEGDVANSYVFFHACLDRIDILLTEKNSNVSKEQILMVLKSLAYFQPKKTQRGVKLSEAYGDFSRKQLHDDPVSVRHGELMRKDKDKFIPMPFHVGRFVF
jgi:hypothetical protein